MSLGLVLKDPLGDYASTQALGKYLPVHRRMSVVVASPKSTAERRLVATGAHDRVELELRREPGDPKEIYECELPILTS